MNNKHEETALAFCKECLGWFDAEPRRADLLDEAEQHCIGSFALERVLPYEDLGPVVEAVTGWCERTRRASLDEAHHLDFGYSSVHSQFHAKLFQQGSHPDAEARWERVVWSSAPCHALLLACLSAHRALEGQRERAA